MDKKETQNRPYTQQKGLPEQISAQELSSLLQKLKIVMS